MVNAGSTFRTGRWRWMVAVAAVAMVAAIAGVQSHAQSPAADAADVAATPRPTLEGPTDLFLVNLFNTNPVVNGTIAALSVISVALFIYFMATVTTGAFAPPDFVNNVTRLVIDRQHKEAADFCRANRGVFLASIVQRCVENSGKEHSVILDMIDAEGARRADVVWNRISYLSDVANVAPMLGLLGTVYGMILAFFGMPTEQMSINSAFISRAIGGAMSTTMFGLIVAIVTLVFYSLVKARLTRVLSEVESAVHTIADHIKRDVDAPRSNKPRAAFIPRDEADL
jgi:biopolymer transport protein ExbB